MGDNISFTDITVLWKLHDKYLSVSLYSGGPALAGSILCLRVPHQARVETYLPEVYPPSDHYPNLLGPADAQRLCDKNVGKY